MIKKNIQNNLLLIIIFLIPLFIIGSGKKDQLVDEIFSVPIKRTDIFVKDYMLSNKIPGMSIAVSHKGRIILSKGFGYANIELKVPVSTKTKFRIASVSKPMTAVLTAYLYQNKIIDIEIPICDILDDFPKKKWDFNIRQLMSHAAGIRHYKAGDVNYKSSHDCIKSGLKIIKDDRLLYKPGSRFSYSSYGYNIIGAAIQKITEKSFADIIFEYLFIPLKMKNSTIDYPYKLIPNRVAAYVLNKQEEIENAPFFDNRYKIPAGGILSTPEDLVLFGYSILNKKKYLNKESLNLLFTPYKFIDEKSSDTGFGWVIIKDENGNKLYGHLGGTTGGCAAIMIYPKEELIIAWVGNLDVDWSDVPTRTVANFFLKAIKKDKY